MRWLGFDRNGPINPADYLGLSQVRFLISNSDERDSNLWSSFQADWYFFIYFYKYESSPLIMGGLQTRTISPHHQLPCPPSTPMSVGRNRYKQLSNIVNTQYGVWRFSVSLYSFTSVQSELGLTLLKHGKARVQALRSCGTRLNNGLHWTNWPKSRFVELVHISTCRELVVSHTSRNRSWRWKSPIKVGQIKSWHQYKSAICLSIG